MEGLPAATADNNATEEELIMATAYLYLLLCSWPHHETCTWYRQPTAFATAEACYREGARRVAANRAAVSGHFIVIECRGA